MNFEHPPAECSSLDPSRPYSHLPTPQSPKSVGQYVGSTYPPESPLASLQTCGKSLPCSTAPKQSYRPTLNFPSHSPSRVQQTMTPDSSPIFPRNAPARYRAVPSDTSFEPLASSLAPAYRISSPFSHLSEPHSSARLSSPFIDKLQSMDQPKPATLKFLPASPRSNDRLQIDDVFSSNPIAPASTPPSSPPPRGNEIESSRPQRSKTKAFQSQDAESRRPEYLQRAKRSLSLSDPFLNEDREAEDHRPVLSNVGITASPNKGRRLKLFQETSEESFEESLMAGGYGRYQTTDWLQHPLPTPGSAGPSNVISLLENEAVPTPKELKKMRRLAAFRESSSVAGFTSKLYPVEMEGKGRVLYDVCLEDPGLTKETPPIRKRGHPRNKKGVIPNFSFKDQPSVVDRAELDRPNWPDSEFPWRLRLEERIQLARTEESHRLKWIENFLDRDSDEEEEDEEEISPTLAWSQGYGDLQTPSRFGRGKMVPLIANPAEPITSSLQRQSTLFPSDPADARTALMSKKSVRSFSYRQRRQARSKKDRNNNYDECEEETVCLCNSRDDGRELVQCDSCQTWYHLQCIGIKSIAELGREEDPWYCNKCTPMLTGASSSAVEQLREPAFARMEDEPSANPSVDLPFFQPSPQDSLMTAWGFQPPTTPTRGSHFGDGFPSGSSWNDTRNGPVTPRRPSSSARVYSTLGALEHFGDEESPFDPTSTPSRGINFGSSSATPKNHVWSFRPNGLFQTPSKQGWAVSSKALGVGAFSSSTNDEPTSSAPSYQNSHSYDDSPIRRTKSGDGSKSTSSRRLLQSPVESRLFANSHPSLDIPSNSGWSISEPLQDTVPASCDENNVSPSPLLHELI